MGSFHGPNMKVSDNNDILLTKTQSPGQTSPKEIIESRGLACA